MGTNYYKVLPIDELKLDIVLSNIKKDLLENGKIGYETEEEFNIIKETRVHIGKQSGGWQFCWRHHDCRYYELNLDSIKEFLNTPGKIVDEYGEEFTFDEFFDKITLYHDKENAINCSDHYNGREHNIFDTRIYTIGGKDYKTRYGEFTENDLLFCVGEFC